MVSVREQGFMYRAVTGQIEVTAEPEFLAAESDPKQGRWFWAYTITISNHGAQAIQLISRHWRITDGHGRVHEVRGAGVVGEQPVLAPGETFQDRFLIADVRMTAPFPTERWFWFDPPFHPGQSVLLHRQPDNVWRIDFQLGWDADPVAERHIWSSQPWCVLGRLAQRRRILGGRRCI